MNITSVDGLLKQSRAALSLQPAQKSPSECRQEFAWDSAGNPARSRPPV
jgi:hypothetical protein